MGIRLFQHLMVLGALATMLACGTGPPLVDPPGGGPTAQQLGECPKDWSYYLEQEGFVGPRDQPIQQLSGPGEKQNIPEFHDCQRFVGIGDPPAPDTFSKGVFAIFAVDAELAFVEDQLFRRAGSQGRARPAAQIIAETDFSPLHLKEGLNCLFLYRQGNTWEARIRPDDKDDAPGCRESVTWSSLSGLPSLSVRREETRGLGWQDYPTVARWNWYFDGQISEYRMGVWCDQAWCEVGGDVPGLSRARADGFPPDPGSLDEPLRRVLGVKGFYDEQILATFTPGGTLSPSSLVGTIVPDINLGRYDQDFFDNNVWLPAAKVALKPRGARTPENPYKDKLNFDLADMTAPNLISLCNGDWAKCGGGGSPPANTCTSTDWWAKIESPSGGRPLYRCVEKCEYDIRIPGAVRWNWKEKDEGIWMRCVNGCCELGPG